MIYNIAGINVDMSPIYSRTLKQSEAYKNESADHADITLFVDKKCESEDMAENPQLTKEDYEYIFLGSAFYNYLIAFGGFLLHSSAVVHNGKAYLFSAPSGTGKSTHTQLWLKRFDDAYIINDDKPAIKIEKNGFFVYGTPFSGKTTLNVNTSVPLGGICVLERSETNYIEQMNHEEALYKILNQTVRPIDECRMDILLKIIDKLITTMPIYRLHCNMDIESADVAYNGMKGED